MSDDACNLNKKSDELTDTTPLGAKILIFISGAAFIALLLTLFTGAFSLAVLGIVGCILAAAWACAVFIRDIPLRFNRITSRLCNRISVIAAVIADTAAVILSGISLSAFSADWSVEITKRISALPMNDTFSFIWNNHVLFIWIAVILLGILSFLSLCAVFHTVIGTRLCDVYLTDGKKTIILFAAASALWVFVPLLSLYLTNLAKVSIEFIGILALIYVIGTLLLYFIALSISKSSFTAFCACVLCWIGLTISGGIITFAAGITELDTVTLSCLYLLVMLILIFLLCYGIRKAVVRFEIDTKKIAKWILGLVLILIVITSIPVIIPALDMTDSSAEANSALSFTVDSALPHPDVYWIHAESMMDSAVLEKYLGCETVGFSDILTEKGFYVNPDAWILSFPRTSSAVPSYLLPDYYDRMRDDYYNSESYLNYPGENIVRENVNAEREANEFLVPFETAGYDTVSLGEGMNNRDLAIPAETVYYFTPSLVSASKAPANTLEKLCYYDLVNELDFLSCSIQALYPFFSNALRSKIQVFADNFVYSFEPVAAEYDFSKTKEYISGDDWLESYGNMIRALHYVLSNRSSPVLMFIDPGALAHFWFTYDENGISIPYSEDIHDYYGQYLLSEKILLYIVDTILENDPDAVIVIQGDHGLHSYTGTDGNKKYIEAFGPETDARELMNHVLSAVYVPDKYRSDEYSEEVLRNPHNIVRYLVNSYAGKNYEYTAQDEFIIDNYISRNLVQNRILLRNYELIIYWKLIF